MAADGTGGDPPRPRTHPRPRLRSRSALAVPAEERLRRRRGGRVADPGGARSDPRPGERVSGERPAVAAGAGDLQLCPHAGQQPRPCGRRAPLSAVPPRASRHHPKGRAPDRKQPDSRHLVGGPPALREVERAPRSAARTPHAPGPVQGPRRRLVRSPPHPSGGTRASRPRDGLGSGARNLGRRIPTRGLRRRPRATLSRRPGKVHPSQRASQRSAWPSSTNSGSRPSRKRGRTKGSSGRRHTFPRCPRSSTALGSIQQHRMVYEQLGRGSLTEFDKEIVEGMHRTDPTGHQLDEISFSKKRVCVEELRHHMQMAGVLTLDETFDKARWGRHWATETMEELFAMKPGEHVLDAFNIEFKSLMDSATFMSFIDRVGKFQLEMQHHFLYGPMALSMPWMRFLEESYHLAAGETLMKAIAVAGILDGGNFGIEDLQQTLNMWYPRGLEMFGSELGGDLVKGVFKTLKNGEAQTIYIDEVRGKVRDVNVAIIQAKARCNREEAEAILRRLTEKGEDGHGLSKDDLVFLPDRRFFRIRGLAEFGDYRMAGSDAAGVGYVYLPYDVHGHVLTEGGKPIDRAAYVDYLRNVLPDRYMRSRHWDFVKEEFLFNEKWGTPEISRHG